MSAFVLKLIAVITMTCDHISYLIFGHFSFLNYIGRIAFPIFAYQITEGYVHTSNLKKYFLRLLIFAVISQIPFMLFHTMVSKGFHLNIFFTLLLGLLSILIYDKLNKMEYNKKLTHISYQILGVAIVLAISFLASFIKCDYGYFGVLSIFIFYLFRNHKLFMNLGYITLVIFYYSKKLFFYFHTTYLLLTICTILPLVFINLYNHKKGKDTKYFLYLFYPLHLLVLWAINFTVSSIL